jgi:hypothetical protein
MKTQMPPNPLDRAFRIREPRFADMLGEPRGIELVAEFDAHEGPVRGGRGRALSSRPFAGDRRGRAAHDAFPTVGEAVHYAAEAALAATPVG